MTEKTPINPFFQSEINEDKLSFTSFRVNLSGLEISNYRIKEDGEIESRSFTNVEISSRTMKKAIKVLEKGDQEYPIHIKSIDIRNETFTRNEKSHGEKHQSTYYLNKTIDLVLRTKNGQIQPFELEPTK